MEELKGEDEEETKSTELVPTLREAGGNLKGGWWGDEAESLEDGDHHL